MLAGFSHHAIIDNPSLFLQGLNRSSGITCISVIIKMSCKLMSCEFGHWGSYVIDLEILLLQHLVHYSVKSALIQQGYNIRPQRRLTITHSF